jgi:hypothetical protein
VRRRAVRGIAVAAALLIAAAAGAVAIDETVRGGSAPAGVASAVPAPADRAALDRVLAESGVRTRRPSPGLASYLAFLIRQAIGWVGTGLANAAGAVALAPAVIRVAAWALAALAAAAVAAAVVVALRRRRRRATGGRRRPAVAGAPAGPPARGAGEWLAEIERRLAAGRTAEALAAVWAWLARALCGAGAEPSWTGAELLAHGRRPDLGPAVARLDAMTYGPRPALPAEVRALVGGLERSLGLDLGRGAGRGPATGPEVAP